MGRNRFKITARFYAAWFQEDSSVILFYGLEIIWFPELSFVAWFSFECLYRILEVKTSKKALDMC